MLCVQGLHENSTNPGDCERLHMPRVNDSINKQRCQAISLQVAGAVEVDGHCFQDSIPGHMHHIGSQSPWIPCRTLHSHLPSLQSCDMPSCSPGTCPGRAARRQNANLSSAPEKASIRRVWQYPSFRNILWAHHSMAQAPSTRDLSNFEKSWCLQLIN